MKYRCKDVFMIRTPTLPIDKFSELLIKNDISELVSDESMYGFLNESLLVSSKSLQKSLNMNTKNKKKEKAYNLSLLKYITRASARPTPYGLFAGVALGKFIDCEKEDLIIIDESKCKRDAKVDTYWICHLIHELEKKCEVLSKLRLQFNTICYRYGDRMKNPYFSNHGSIDNLKNYVEENNIKYSPLIDIIKENSKSFIAYKELKSKICENYEGVPEHIIDNTLAMLVENEYLLTDLRLPAYCNDSLEHVIQKLESNKEIEDLTNNLKKLKRLIDVYNKSTAPVEDVEIIENIYEIMEKLHTTKDYMEVNRGLVLEKNNLPMSLKKKIENFANTFCDIYLESEHYPKLDKFISEFSEQYGLNVELPLKEIIDPNGFDGLSLIESKPVSIRERERKIRKVIDNKIISALMNNQEDVMLTKDDFAKTIDKYAKTKAPKSFDINFFITKVGDEYNIVAGPNKGSSKAGSMFQRFANLFDRNLLKEYNEIYREEINISEDEYILVESRELNISGRSNNVTNRFKNHSYYIPIALTDEDTSNQITVEDLLIGLSQDRKLYIKSKSENRICKIVEDNMLNSAANSKMLGFLKEISNKYEDKFIDRLYMLYDNKYVYTPRINFEGIIIEPRKWILTYEMLELDTFEAFKMSFQKHIHQYHIDKLIYLCEYDNRLILDLEREESMDILYSSAKKNKKLELCELEDGLFNGSIVKDKKERSYVSEMVFSFILNNEKNDMVKQNIENYVKDNLILHNKNRIFPPFKDGWIYIKLYGIGNREDEVLKNIPNILEVLETPKFFYLRYFDKEGKHLRIRFKFSDEKKAIEKMQSLNTWLLELQEKTLINRWIFDVYQREINRYGGTELIEEVENLFYKDSTFTIHILSLFDIEQESELEKAYIVGLGTMLKRLTKSEVDMFEILDINAYPKVYREEFKKNRQKYMDIVENILTNEIESIDYRIVEIRDSILARGEALKNFEEKLSKAVNNKRNTNSRKDIILSLVHMYCNRLTGIRGYEEKYLAIIRHALYHHIEKEKHMRQVYNNI
ncbi:lantibiotic dehydratase [Tissierella sp. MB52-C2]|uniref:lantibiotic dehydratase n=1 Tax=Tissierella sp. MB52-C2 TaxID=3070999 RepID=UPI00280AFF50|nr:lantibiotic dehydratase [Tissierella sp. MB52-C2]WMM25767.1 lantibiotic dehydratase [Tissierella sp. MB52-C2]